MFYGLPLASRILFVPGRSYAERPIPDEHKAVVMSQLLLIALLVGVLVTLLIVRQKKGAYAKRRWMPDIRRVV